MKKIINKIIEVIKNNRKVSIYFAILLAFFGLIGVGAIAEWVPFVLCFGAFAVFIAKRGWFDRS